MNRSRPTNHLGLWVGAFFALSLQAQAIDFADRALYPVLREHTTFEMQSSYDRTGGNDDGFRGTHGIIRIENGNAVIAETTGKGMITRIWFPFDRGSPFGPMWLNGKHLYIYLDDAETPAIALPAVELFNGTDRNFPYPLCGMDLGGCWFHLPIPFNKGAKVAVEGEKVGFFHVQFTKIHDDRPWQPFTLDTNPVAQEGNTLVRGLKNSGNLDFLKVKDPVEQELSVRLKAGENEFGLKEGANILRAFIAEAEGLDLAKFLAGRMHITWDNQSAPAVDAPLSMFFIQESGGLNGKSFMAGRLSGGRGVYNLFPMPYQNRARVKITVPEACEVRLKFTYEEQAEPDPKLAYFSTNYVFDKPTTPGEKHRWLDIQGTGHYVGVYMRGEGPSSGHSRVNYTKCFEGDETFIVDGKLVSHGTGSEDYFNAGWNGADMRLDHAKALPFHGYTLFDAATDRCSGASYRWHLPHEVIPFKESLKAQIEVGPTDNVVGNYESLVFFYLKGN